MMVQLSSGSAAATVPPSVTIPAGAIRATFPVGPARVSHETIATISASAAGATRSATLTIPR